MSYGIQSKKLKKLVDYYSPLNNGEEIKFLSFFKGDQGLLRYLQTSPFQGIDSTSLEERTAWFGSNQYVQLKDNNLLSIFLYPFTHFALKLHFFISIIAIVISFFCQQNQVIPHSWLGSAFNLAMFALVYIILLVPEIYQYLQNQKLKNYVAKAHIVRVWRDNQKKQINSSELVVGDIVELEIGSFIGADGLIIEGNVTVKQPMNHKQLTVQKYTTKKCIRKWAQEQQKQAIFSLETRQPLPSPILLKGSEVICGEGRMLILCVGKFSRLGYFIQQIHRSAIQRRSEVEQKMSSLLFHLSKYIVLSLILLILLYIGKIVIFLILQSSLSTENWKKVFVDLTYSLTIALLGLPISQVIGLGIGSIYIKYQIHKTDGIWFKYIKDCANIKDVTTFIFDKIEYDSPLKLVRWWNFEEQDIQISEIPEKNLETNGQFEDKFLKSLMCQDFQPYQVGLKLTSFFIGMNSRLVRFMQISLNEFAKNRMKISKGEPKQIQSQIKIIESSSSIEKQMEIIYIKGNSQTLLKECTHILNKKTGSLEQINDKVRQKIIELIWKMNASQNPSLITGYIEVNPNHPKFRQSGYKIVMLSLIFYRENNDNEEFQSLAKMRRMGMTITLMGNHSHDQSVSLCKEMGIIMIDKPSIRLRGYDFHKIVGGIICKNCKKQTCICIPVSKYSPCLKNQDEFNKICKHLSVLSEANCIQKTTFAIGFACAKQKTCFFGTTIQDVPAMRLSTLSVAVSNQLQDEYAMTAAEVILPDKKLLTIQKLIVWGIYYQQFCRKYIVFGITPCLVAFASSCISFILYDNFSITLIQFIWVSAIICPILGLTFLIQSQPILQNYQENKKKDQPLLDKISYRQIHSQVIIQTILIIFLIALGPTFLPEEADKVDEIIGSNWSAKYYNQNKNTVCSGTSNSIFNHLNQVYSKTINKYGIYSRHMTFVFNLFVLMQFINYFNCRNLGQKSVNFVQGFTILKLVCIVFALGLQILIIFTGGSAFGLYPYGLSLKQWTICLGISLVVSITGLITKQIPFQNENEQKFIKVWPNRCYNLAVMATVPRESLQDFEIDEQLQIRKMAMANQ